MTKKPTKKTPTNQVRIAAYVRVSSQRQATEGDSLDAQRNEIIKYIDHKKGVEGWEVLSFEVYEDAGRSAKDQNRPELQRLKRDIAADRIDIVIAFKMDRLTRSILDFLELWKLFSDHNVRVVSLRENFDTTSVMGEAMLKLIMVFAELERKLTAERTVAIMLDRISRGLWNGGWLHGYRADTKEGRLIPDPEWAPIIQTHFFDAVERLGSAGAVQRELHRLGIRTPVRESRAGKVRGGKHFSKQQVITILRNPLYIGSLKYGDQLQEDNHEPIISKAQFERVQRLLDETTKRRTNHRYDRGHVYLLRGLVRCGCGAMMTPKGAVGRCKTHHYYECTRQIHGGGQALCSAPRIQAEALDRAVKARVITLANNVTERERIAEEALKALGQGSEQIESDIAAVRHRLMAIQAETQNLVGALRRLGEKAAETVGTELDRLAAEKDGLEERLRDLEAEAAPRAEIAGTAKQFIEGWGNLGELLARAEPEEQRAILQHFVEVVELRSVDPAKKVGTYALRLFPGVSLPHKTAQGEDLGADERFFDQAPSALTEGALVRKVDEKAPRVGLEPTTNRLRLAPMFP